MHPEDIAAVEGAVRHAVETNNPLNIEFRIIRPGGEMRWLASQARVFTYEQGNPCRLARGQYRYYGSANEANKR